MTDRTRRKAPGCPVDATKPSHPPGHPEHVSEALARVLERIRQKPIPCAPKNTKGAGRVDGHKFVDCRDGWLRCRVCGWFARP